jgi:plasmid stabilization system protein ParE
MDVIWTTGATNEFQQAFEYLLLKNESSAAALINEVTSAIDLIQRHPNLGSFFEKPVRKWLVGGRYGLIYRVENRGIIILAFANMIGDLRPLHDRLRHLFDTP